MPEGVYHRALKAEAEIIEGDIGDLLWDLAVYRYALQRVIDILWDLGEIPRKAQAHQMFYGMLRSYGLRAHVARNVYNAALALVESAKANGGLNLLLEDFQLGWTIRMLRWIWAVEPSE